MHTDSLDFDNTNIPLGDPQYVDPETRALLAGRRVCIVGNGASGPNCGTDIDGSDVVIRFNDRQSLGRQGHRTDLLVTCFASGSEHPANVAAVASLVPEKAAPGVRVLNWRGAAASLEKSLGCLPSAGLVAIAQSIAAEARSVRLVDMDLSPRFDRAGYPNRRAPPSFYHNFVGERRLFAKLDRLARGRRIGWDSGPGLAEAIPQPPNRDSSEVVDQILKSRTKEILEVAVREGPSSLERFTALTESLIKIIRDSFSLNILDESALQAQSQLLGLELLLTVPRPGENRQHPWWLYRDDTMRAVELLAVALRRFGRGLAWSVPQRVIARLRERFVTGTLSPIGRGCEGLVLSDGRVAVKWFVDPIGSRPVRPILERLVGCDVYERCIPDVHAVDEIDGHLVILSKLMPAQPADPQSIPVKAWTRFVAACRRSGVTCVNFNLENFGLVDGRLCYLDLGNGIRNWTPEAGADHVRRCWLAHRHWNHPSFALWLRQATDRTHPTLLGLELFDAACEALVRSPETERDSLEIPDPLGIRFVESNVDQTNAIITTPWKPLGVSQGRRLLWKAGWQASVIGLPSDVRDGPWSSPSVIRWSARPRPTVRPMSLMIRCCAMDHRLVIDAIPHLVRSLEIPWPFQERLVVVDERQDGFPRPYDRPDLQALLNNIEELITAGWIDRLIVAPSDEKLRAELYARWFGSGCLVSGIPSSHADNGQGLLATLTGIEQCACDTLMAIDVDMMFSARRGGAHWRAEVEQLFASQPDAAFISPSVPLSQTSMPTSSDERGAYRPCPRVSVIARDRLNQHLPRATSANDGFLPAWHRALHGAAPVWRLHHADFGFIHPDNQKDKGDLNRLSLIRERIEAGNRPLSQIGTIDLDSNADWLLPKRAERMVVILTGRNPGPGIAMRCLDSLDAQDFREWGALVIDDASQDGTDTVLDWRVGGDSRFTLIKNSVRQGGLENLVRAMREGCTGKDTVIVTLDIDDVLLGDDALGLVMRTHEAGADLTVGSMFRRDKPFSFPPNFERPRSERGNVWQHLRSFRRSLFLQIPDAELRRSDGRYVAIACDWAYMVPMCELAQNPQYIPDEIYYYDCPGKTTERRSAARESIASIKARPPLGRSPQLP